MIRPATIEDLPALVELGRAMHDESAAWSRLTFCAVQTRATLLNLIQSDHGCVILDERDGLIAGGVAAFLAQHWGCVEFVAHELALFIRPDARGGSSAIRLVAAMKEWAWDQGAVSISAGTSTGVKPEACAKLYERAGFVRSSIGFEAFFGT